MGNKHSLALQRFWIQHGPEDVASVHGRHSQTTDKRGTVIYITSVILKLISYIMGYVFILAEIDLVGIMLLTYIRSMKAFHDFRMVCTVPFHTWRRCSPRSQLL